MNALAPRHVQLLTDAAIDLDVAIEAPCYSDRNSLVFTWTDIDGHRVAQTRPDKPTGDAKYLWTPGAPTMVWVHPRMASRVGEAKKGILVEGTKQYLAAVSHADKDTLVLGVAGCWGWSKRGVPLPDVARCMKGLTDLTVAFDADYSTNRTVWDAASRLVGVVRSFGVDNVQFLEVPRGREGWPRRLPRRRRRQARLPGQPHRRRAADLQAAAR